MALTGSEIPEPMTARRALRYARAWFADQSHGAVAQRIAGTAFLIRIVSAVLAYGTQVALARWMGSHEFGIFVYVWTWVMLIGGLADLGLASAAQRFIPEYSESGALAKLRGYLSGSRWMAFGIATRDRASLRARHPSRARLARRLHHRAALARLRLPAGLRRDACAGRHRALVQLGQSGAGAGLYRAPARRGRADGRGLACRRADRRGLRRRSSPRSRSG